MPEGQQDHSRVPVLSLATFICRSVQKSKPEKPLAERSTAGTLHRFGPLLSCWPSPAVPRTGGLLQTRTSSRAGNNLSLCG
jgi:hypothetical protein